MAYARPLTHNVIIMYVFLTFMILVVATMMNMIYRYIGDVNRKLHSAYESNVNLLNGMHEGLLILSQSTPNKPSEFLYCNRSAQNLI